MSVHDFPRRSAQEPSPPDSLLMPWPTFAEPLTFAPPIAVEEQEGSFSIHFHVAGRSEEDLEVVIEGQTLFILGEALPRTSRKAGRARRAFALPASLDGSHARLRLVPPVLEVHIVKATPSPSGAIVVRGR